MADPSPWSSGAAGPQIGAEGPLNSSERPRMKRRIGPWYSSLYIQRSSVWMFGCLCITFYVTGSIVNNSAIWGLFGEMNVSTELLGLRQRVPNMIRNRNSGQEPPESSTTPTKDFMDMQVLCTFISNVESWILEHGLFVTFWTPPYHNHEPKPQSGTSRVLHNSRPGLRGHEGSLHLSIQCRKLNFRT